MTMPKRLCWIAGASALVLSGCLPLHGREPDVVVVRDLSKVAGCRFVATVRPPSVQPGLRRAEASEAYGEELLRRTARLGGTHLYLMNEAAGWGAADALGTVYRCVS